MGVPYSLGKLQRNSTQDCLLLLFVNSFDELFSPELVQFIQKLNEDFLESEAYWLQDARSTDLG